MQHLIVAVAVTGALVFIALRLWRTFRNPSTLSCSCGCSGCASTAPCDASGPSLPMHKP